MGSGRRTIVLHRGMEIKPQDIKTSTLPDAKIIHLDGRDLDACIKLAKWGRKQGSLISFDIGSVRNDVSPIFPLVDHLVVADSYALPFTKTRSPRKAIEKLRGQCPGTIVITLGMKGQLAFEDGKFYRQTPFQVGAVDTTGAGDAFHTGYLYALLEGATMQTRLIYGSAVAALKCLKMGARSGLPNKTALIRFLNKVQG
jgi:sugar/nucleoside kinase (ribokinase family)